MESNQLILCQITSPSYPIPYGVERYCPYMLKNTSITEESLPTTHDAEH